MRSIWVVALALAGCSGDGNITEHEGFYTIATWTVNPQGCDTDGPSVAETRDGFAFVRGESFLGTEFVNLVTCATAAECEEKARDPDTIHLGGFTFEDGSDGAGWTHHSSFGFMRDVSCEARAFDTTLRAPSAGQLRVEHRTSVPATYAPTNGECSEEGAEAASANQPCAELEAVTLTKTGDL